MSAFLLVLPIAAVAVALGSLRWRFQHDSPLLLYIAFATDKLRLVPYRDLFDFNLPGSYLIYRAIGLLSQYTDFGVRCCDLALLALTAFLSWRWIRPLGRRVAACGAAVWVLAYLGGGSYESLQREFILMPVMLLALLWHDGLLPANVGRRLGAAALWGVVAIIKPQAAIGFAVVATLDAVNVFRRDPGYFETLRVVVLPAIVGFSVPLAGVLTYLSSVGALPAFLDIAINYWPLYAHISGDYEPLSGIARLQYVLDHFRAFDGARMLPLALVGAVLGGSLALQDPTLSNIERRRVALLIGLFVAYWVYPAIAGTFSTYHWIPSTYFVVQLMALGIAERTGARAPAYRLFCAGVLAFTLLATLPVVLFARSLGGRPLAPPKEGRVDQIAAYLNEHLRDGDTVQPLDWTGGAVHAMLIAQARIATPFLYDFPFYFDVSNDYVQALRRTFMERLRAAHPRFVIDVREHKSKIHGRDTCLEFPALESELLTWYRPVLAQNGFVIYERRPAAEPPSVSDATNSRSFLGCGLLQR